MLKIRSTQSMRTTIIVTIVTLLSIVAVVIALRHAAPVEAATIINVTTTVDEDSAPAAGAGCSIYEATIAANTDTAYAGCPAGSGVDTIMIPAGIYIRDTSVDETAEHLTITLNDTSLIGAGAGLTNLQSYWLLLTGNAATSVEGIHFSNTLGSASGTLSASTEMYVEGSNKLLRNLQITTDNEGSFYTYPGWNGVETSGLTMTNIDADNTTFSYARVECVYLCPDTSLSNLQLKATYNADVKFYGSPRISLTNSILTGGYGSVIEVGADSSLNTIEQYGTGSSTPPTSSDLDIYTDAGSSVSNVLQKTYSAGGTIELNGVADSVTNIQQLSEPPIDADGTSLSAGIDTLAMTNYEGDGKEVIINNGTSGAVLNGITMTSNSGATQIYSDALTLNDISMNSTDGGDMGVASTYSGATYSAIYMTQQNGNPYSVALGSSSVGGTYRDINVTTDSYSANMYLGGGNEDVTIENAHFVNATVSIGSVNDLSIDGLQVSGATGTYGLSVSNVIGTATISDVLIEDVNMVMGLGGSGPDTSYVLSNISIKDQIGTSGPPAAIYGSGVGSFSMIDSYISNTKGGVMVNGTGPGSTGTLENVVFEGVADLASTPGAIFMNDVADTSIKNVMIDQSLQQSPGGVISINGGSNHLIENVTSSNSNGGILFSTSGSPAVLAINNSTFINSLNGGVYDTGSLANDNRMLTIIGDPSELPVVNITNSIMGGSSEFIECSVTDATLTVANSLASDASCVAAGFGDIQSLTGLAASTPEVNSSQRPHVGYNAADGQVKTLALLEGSEALAAGGATSCAVTDARGVSRDSAYCDLGAYQRSTPPITQPGTGNGGNDNSGVGSGTNQSNNGSGVVTTTAGVTEDEASEMTQNDSLVDNTPVKTPSAIDNGQVEDEQDATSNAAILWWIVAPIAGVLVIAGITIVVRRFNT